MPNAFPERGGALQCALRAGLLAVKLCDVTIFDPGATAAERMEGDRQYRWLAFCATLATVYLQSVAHVQQILDTGEIYSHANDDTLLDLKQSYLHRWRSNPNLSITRLYPFLSSFFFPGSFAHLKLEMLGELGMAINPPLSIPATEIPLGKVVRMAVDKTIADDMQARSKQIGSSSVQPGTASPDAVGGTAPAAEQEISKTTNIAVTSEVGADAASTINLTSGQAGNSGQKQKSESPDVTKAKEWLKAIGMVDQMDEQVIRHEDGRCEFSRKALGFGAAPRDTYNMLHAAGFVDSRSEKSATLKVGPSDIYWQSRTSRGDSR